MNFRTEVNPIGHAGMISHKHHLWLIGSCFSDNIGRRLADDLFAVTINPFGPLYNPMSIAAALDRLISRQKYTRDDLINTDGVWRCYDFHSRFASTDPDKALAMMNGAISNTPIPDILIITLGSDATFTLNESKHIVANCHKQPQSMFNLEHQPIGAMTDALHHAISRMRSLNPAMQTIVTVSPIRHIGYGASVNSLGKARLICAAHALTQLEPNTCYFPSYEIMVDDLRDYRFYAADMIHLSDVAVEYIYDIFRRSFFDDDTIALANRCSGITRRLRHRPITDDHEAFAKFNRQTMDMARALAEQHPCLASTINQLLLTPHTDL